MWVLAMISLCNEFFYFSENKKFRDAAKKERNELVRSLATFIKKRDKRVQKFNKELSEKNAQNQKKTQEMRNRHLEERRQMLEDAQFGMSEMEEELQKLEDQLDANEEDELFCVACNKELRNEKAFAAHRNQKKHLENVRLLKESMMEEDLLNSDDLKDSDEDLPQEANDNHDTVEAKQLTESVLEEETPKAAKGKNKKKGKGKKNAKNASSAKVNELQCAVCNEEFTSKNKLFSHLKESGHAVALKS